MSRQEFAPSDEELEAYRKGEQWDPKVAEQRRRQKVKLKDTFLVFMAAESAVGLLCCGLFSFLSTVCINTVMAALLKFLSMLSKLKNKGVALYFNCII